MIYFTSARAEGRHAFAITPSASEGHCMHRLWLEMNREVLDFVLSFNIFVIVFLLQLQM